MVDYQGESSLKTKDSQISLLCYLGKWKSGSCEARLHRLIERKRRRCPGWCLQLFGASSRASEDLGLIPSQSTGLGCGFDPLPSM